MRFALLGPMLGLTIVVRPAHGQAADGLAVYKQECKSCHGINGVPPARERAKYKKIRTLGDSGFVADLSKDSIVTILKNGIDKNMKSFKDKLEPDEMEAVAGYIKDFAEKKRTGG